MPDGSSGRASRRAPRAKSEVRICESASGKYFCKRDRNKDGTISIYTCKGRQTVPVGKTGESSPSGEVISPVKLARIELALARFVSADADAAQREAEGITKCDMHVKDCVVRHSLTREAFHAEVLKRIEALLEKALHNGSLPEAVMNLRFQAKRAKKAGDKEAWTWKNIIGNLESTWPDKPGPTVSEFEAPMQKTFLKKMRSIGYSDKTILMFLWAIFGAINQCDRDALLLLKVPKCLRRVECVIETDDEDVNDVNAADLEEMAALFNASADEEEEWRYMNGSTTGARTNTIVEAVWRQVDLDENAPRWKLNPPGKRRTKKRRPKIAICPTLAAEMRTWTRDCYRIVSNGKGKPVDNGSTLFAKIRDKAGLKHLTAMSVRRFIRTWLMLHGVPEGIADMFIGHADDGSATGRKFYKSKDPKYMLAVTVALEKLYDALRPLVDRPFAMPTRPALRLAA